MEDVNQQAAEKRRLPVTPCLCAALRQASRAVTRIYDAELRATGLRVTQFTLLSLLSRSGEVRQGDLGEMASLGETTPALAGSGLGGVTGLGAALAGSGLGGVGPALAGSDRVSRPW